MYGTEKSFSSNNNRPKKIFFVLFEQLNKCVPVVCVYDRVTFSAVIVGLYFPLFVLRVVIYIHVYTFNTIPITCIHLHQLLISIKMSGSMNSCLWVIKINNNFSQGLQSNWSPLVDNL